MPVLKTRLYRPALNKDLIRRDLLLAEMRGKRHIPLTLVIAGAGYGKSVLISQWLEYQNIRHCWISLEEDCNDIRIMLSYFVAAVQSVFPSSFKQLEESINAIELPSVDTLKKLAINELTEIENPLTIVLDDFYRMNNVSFNTILEEILKNPPPSVKFIIISRFDPPIPLNNLRVYNQVHEIRMTDLNFSSNEISQLADISYNISIATNVTDNIYKVTEGWILGIQVILKKIATGNSISESVGAISVDKNYFTEYLLNHILIGQHKVVQTVLMIASLFERFSIEMIFHLYSIQNKDSSEVEIMDKLQETIDSSMFIISLDDKNKWFRFHHLIQDFLKKQLNLKFTEEQINELYRKGSSFFKHINMPEEAIIYAVKANCYQMAGEIICSHKHMLFNHDQFHVLKRWLQLLPPGVIDNNVSLLLGRCMIHDTTADFESMGIDLEHAKNLMDSLQLDLTESQLLRGEYHSISSSYCFFTGQLEKSMQHADKALELLQVSSQNYIHDYALAYKLFGLHISGKADEAEALLDRKKQDLTPENQISLLKIESIRELLYLLQGKYTKLKYPALTALKISKKEKLWVNYSMAVYSLAGFYYVQNQLNEVEFYCKSIEEHSYSARPYWVINNYIIKALALLASGDRNALEQYLKSIYTYAGQFQDNNYTGIVYAFEVEIALRLKDLDRAREISLKADFNPYIPVYHYYFPQLTRIKLLMAEGESIWMDEAKELLDKYLLLSNQMNNITFRIQVLALYALWHYKLTDMKEAVSKLRDAIDYALKGNFIRTFLDMGEDMRILMEKMTSQEKRNPFIRRILNLMESEENTIEAQQIPEDIQPSVELTKKEINILSLITKGYRNKEIADKLFLSEPTIKTYIYRLYQKMEVKNRIEAINKAKDILSVPVEK